MHALALPARARRVPVRTGNARASDAVSFLSIPAITLRWVLRLRWGAVAGQAAMVAATSLALNLALPLVPLASIIGVTAITNLALQHWMRIPREVTPSLVAVVLGIDVLSLCGLLYFTGGPSNPFSVLFLVQITIAALILGTRYSAGIVAVSVAAYAFLFFDNVPLAGVGHVHHTPGSGFDLHLQGMFVAFTLAAMLIAYFVTRVSAALRMRDAELAEAQRLAAANERLASLSTLAAGAAHELGTPLGTIAIASKELDRAAVAAGVESLCEDARLIRQEVDRCRDIVQQMSARAGGAFGEVPERIEVLELMRELRKRLNEGRNERLDVRTSGATSLHAPLHGLAQTLASLVKNAFDATDDGGARVVLAIEVDPAGASFSVMDEGTGIAPEALERVGEPFFTTKPPGTGMGLGVFLARSFAERFGGSLTLTSRQGAGTRAVLMLPHEER